jgi:hypothetical protein
MLKYVNIQICYGYLNKTKESLFSDNSSCVASSRNHFFARKIEIEDILNFYSL